MQSLSKSANLAKRAIDAVRSKSNGKARYQNIEITINFHLDRYTSTNTPLLVSIVKDGCIKSQFETGTSNGGLSAFLVVTDGSGNNTLLTVYMTIAHFANGLNMVR